MYFRDGSAQTILRAATLRQKLQIKAFHLTQSQYTDTGPTSPRTDPITPGAWQGSHWNDSTPKEPSASQVHTEISRSRGGRLTQGHRCGATRVSLGFLYFRQHASVSQERIRSDSCTRCHTEIEVAELIFHRIQSQYTEMAPPNPPADSIMSGFKKCS